MQSVTFFPQKLMSPFGAGRLKQKLKTSVGIASSTLRTIKVPESPTSELKS